MTRALSPTITADLLRQEASDQLLFFLTIDHADLGEPIRVVRDSTTSGGEALTYTWQGLPWQGFPFEVNWLSDTDSAPTARLTVPNVDRKVGQAVDALTSAPEIRIDLVLASEFDLTVNPRVPLAADPVPEASAIGLGLYDAEVNTLTVTGTLKSWDYTQEVYPNLRATRTRCPALAV